MAQQIGNSELLRTWANDGTVVVPADAKIDEGWLRGEQPPHEWMNYIHNVLGQKINHMLSRGVPDWNNSTEFNPGAVVNHDDDLWLALVTNDNSEPSAANSDWARIVDQSKDATINGLTVGRGTGSIATNTVVGQAALTNNTTGASNTALGRDALVNNTTGASNTALGRAALASNTTGFDNTALGRSALFSNTTGVRNTALGRDALVNNTTGSENIAVGSDALANNTTGIENTALGRDALLKNTTGGSNTAVGFRTLRENTTGAENTALGRDPLLNNTTGIRNTAVGRSALANNTTGADNTAVGHEALNNTTTGGNNIGIGPNAGRAVSPFMITTQNNRIVMGNNNHTDAYIRIAWTVTSDARDKTKFAPIPHGLDFINGLSPTEYQFKAGGRDGEADGRRRYGFLAQDVLALEGDNPVIADAEDEENLKLHESYLVPVLVNAVKELTAQVQSLQSEVNKLKGK